MATKDVTKAKVFMRSDVAILAVGGEVPLATAEIPWPADLRKDWVGSAQSGCYQKWTSGCRTVSNVAAPLEPSTPESLLMGMVDSLDREEPAEMTQQANTDFLAAESPGSSSSTPSDWGHSRVPEPMIGKRKNDQDTVEQELLRHLSTKMTRSEALGYSIGAAIQHWNTETYALFSADVHRLIAEYEVIFQNLCRLCGKERATLAHILEDCACANADNSADVLQPLMEEAKRSED
ncbi:hypothetical protein HPB47_007166 [Ixodes persulcatus]|uniref:Uncharacterized protein n=1 Tax=Ixodes persulcatus TaxID=34615 RepID=A0AC60P8F0_IXOPE|nr:hypothetical protein HPB47_007166 [Ixodes persulcatus]